jgi:alpha-1,3-rhamnosyl/mannosyltransferase
MGLWHPCPATATVYDMGVELWHGVPYLDHVRASRYWAVQKMIARSLRQVMCISCSTAGDLVRVIPALQGRTRVVYPPLDHAMASDVRSRKSYFITLGGAPTKNLVTVLRAFTRFRREGGRARLVVLGELAAEEEIHGEVPAGVTFESMAGYHEHLRRCAGLLYCSSREGLGLPPLEAMARGCPLLVSDIASVHETCEGAGIFVPPWDVDGCAAAMHELLRHRARWARASREGAARYRTKANRSLNAFTRRYPGGWLR